MTHSQHWNGTERNANSHMPGNQLRSARWAPPLYFNWLGHGYGATLRLTTNTMPFAKICDCWWSQRKQVPISFWAGGDLCVSGWWRDHWSDTLFKHRRHCKVQPHSVWSWPLCSIIQSDILTFVCRYTDLPDAQNRYSYSYNPCTAYQDSQNKGDCDNIYVSDVWWSL